MARRGSSRPGSIGNCVLSAGSSRIRRASSGERMFAFGAPRWRNSGERRRGRQLGVGAHMQVGGAHAVVQPERLGVDLHHLGLGIHVAAVDGVIVEARADGDDEIGLLAQLARDVAGEAAGDAERERIVIEHAAGEQRGRQQRAALLGQRLDLACRAGAHDAAAGDDDRHFAPASLSTSCSI